MHDHTKKKKKKKTQKKNPIADDERKRFLQKEAILKREKDEQKCVFGRATLGIDRRGGESGRIFTGDGNFSSAVCRGKTKSGQKRRGFSSWGDFGKIKDRTFDSQWPFYSDFRLCKEERRK